MTCEIIQFAAARDFPKRGKASSIMSRELEQQPERPPATETAKDQRLRLSRRDAWRAADRVTYYWRARLNWQSALETAQRHGIADSASFPRVESRFDYVDKWARGGREAVANARAGRWRGHLEASHACRE